jgi:hypothetical protein
MPSPHRRSVAASITLAKFCAILVTLVVAAAAVAAGQAQPRRTVSVATWNIRAGYGTLGLRPNPPFDADTKNCTDPARPQNAWGTGFSKRFVQADVGADADVIALGLQEAWGDCGNVKNIAALLGWKAFVPERNGVGMVARFGIEGGWDTWKIESRGVAGATEDRWIVGGNVCADAGCTRTVHVWATHLAPAADREWPAHVARALALLADKKEPHLFVGDFNLWQNDRWSPQTPCGTATPAMATALALFPRAGYVDAWAATQSGPGWTGMVSRRGCGAGKNGGVFKRIDYIWSKGLRPLSATRIGVVEPGAPGPSDHMGLKAQFALDGR